jgi:hypothetical protein
MNRAEFGIGCLTFAPVSSDMETGGLSSRELGALWKKEIEDGLALLPSVTKLAVEFGEIYFRMPSRVDPLLKGDDEDLEPTPIENSFIGFTVTIPKRMHAEIVPFSRISNFKCEQFQFYTVYCESGPVTFVRCLQDPGLEFIGSYPLVLVREFVKRELRRLEAPIELKALGPSPFWG